jgi:hypothetical protein
MAGRDSAPCATNCLFVLVSSYLGLYLIQVSRVFSTHCYSSSKQLLEIVSSIALHVPKCTFPISDCVCWHYLFCNCKSPMLTKVLNNSSHSTLKKQHSPTREFSTARDYNCFCSMIIKTPKYFLLCSYTFSNSTSKELNKRDPKYLKP